jgi:hypothetical protein
LLPHNKELFKNTFGTLNNQNNHKFSILYNAYTEKRQGPILKEHYRDYIHTIHADSGGLQMVTLGKTITEQLKDDVYSNQALNSDIAMCFDVIPVKMLSDKSEKLDLDNRRFDPTMLEECARATGKNIRKQIEYFLEQKTTAKPFLITQGNCYDSYMKWVEYIVDELPPEYVQFIGGIAMGAAALGKGTLEDIKRAFYFTQLPIDVKTKHLHLLGVGAVYRVIPNLIFYQNGVYDGTEISYDSTTHTASITRGLYFKGNRMFDYSRDMSHKYQILLNDIENNFPGQYQYDIKMFHECLNTPPSKIGLKYGSLDPSIQTTFVYVASAIKNFTKCIDEMSSSKAKVMDFLKGIEKNSFSALYDVHTLDDFNHWLKHVGPYVESEPVRLYNTQATLEDLFI